MNGDNTTGETGSPDRPVSAEDLREKEAFNFALFQYHPDAATVVDGQGCVVKSNLARRNAPIPLPEIGSRLFEDDGDRYAMDMRTVLMKCIETNAVQTVPEIEHNGSYEAITIAPLPHGAIVITRDITARKLAEAEIVHAQKLAALGTMVSGVAHEISNPNNVMILTASALEKMVSNLLPILDQYQKTNGDFDVGRFPYSEIRKELPDLVAAVGRAAERIGSLVADLKDFAHKEPSDVRLPMNTNKVIEDAVSMVGSVIKRRTSRFEVNYAEDLPPVDANEHRIEQVVVNLLTNALDALPDRACGVTVSTRLSTGSDEVIIEVSDEGEGISDEHMAKIMDPFFTTKHDTGGTGLGLSISRKIIDSHGGSLTFSSSVGKGTVATIRLPCMEERKHE